jgi:hypothetical protein
VKTPEEIKQIIMDSTGTTAYHRYSPFRTYPVITDGVLAVAIAAECFWLLDIIGSYQSNEKLDKYFQVWKLTKHDDGSATLEGFNDVDLIVTQEIKSTNFPLSKFELWLEGIVILLPFEH